MKAPLRGLISARPTRPGRSDTARHITAAKEIRIGDRAVVMELQTGEHRFARRRMKIAKGHGACRIGHACHRQGCCRQENVSAIHRRVLILDRSDPVHDA